MAHPTISLLNVVHIDVPGSRSTSPTGINNSGQVVGSFVDAAEKTHGFLYDAGAFVQLDYPGAASTSAAGINSLGQIVGTWYDGQAYHGFQWESGVYSAALNCPGAANTFAAGINDLGMIVGYGDFGQGVSKAFVYVAGKFTVFSHPECRETHAVAVNNGGQILLRCFRTGGHEGNVYLYNLGVFSGFFSYDKVFGDGRGNELGGINNNGQVVGWFQILQPRVAYLYDAAVCSQISIPDGVQNGVSAINDHGQIAGQYTDTQGKTHAYLAVVPV